MTESSHTTGPSLKAAAPDWLVRIDHVSWTVADLDAVSDFYCKVFGARELYRMGPVSAADLPRGASGRDWMDEHVNVPGATLTLAMLELAPNLNFELFQYDKPEGANKVPLRNCDVGGHHIALRVKDVDAAVKHMESFGCKPMAGTIMMDEGPCAGVRNRYIVDPWGNQLELVQYLTA